MKVHQWTFKQDELLAPEIVQAFAGWQRGDWAWCLHCERCYQVGEFRISFQVIGSRSPEFQVLQMCPYDDCSGDAVTDAWHWEQIREANGYPEIPERGKVYPQYADQVSKE